MVAKMGMTPDNKDIAEIDFVFFDVETTGLDSKMNRIIEIGAIKMRGSQILGEYSKLINPDCEIPAKITEITRISQDMVRNQPVFSEICREFLDFCKNTVMVAHNADFDRLFLYEEIKRSMYDCLPFDWIDTVKLARVAYPHFQNHKLQTIAKNLEIDTGSAHRAKDDAITCSKIFWNCIEVVMRRMTLKRLVAIEKLGGY